MKEYELYTGAYTGSKEEAGVRSWRFDGRALREAGHFCGLENPSYVLPWEDRLYVVEELPGRAGAACLSREEGGGLRALWHREVPGAGLCHITASGGRLYASGYAGGTLTGLDAASGEPCFYQEFHGHGPNAQRQERAHIHSAQPAPEGARLLVADLGTDRLYQFVQEEGGTLRPEEGQPWLETGPGQGPRHFAFHLSGKWIYLVTELDSSLLVLRREGDRLEKAGEYPLRQASDPAETWAADIHLSPDGRFLYASVRGPGCLCGFQVLGEGEALLPLGRFPTGGSCPRSFALSPDGRYVAAANQEPGNLVLFPREEKTGLLGEALCSVEIPQAACVKWRE